MKYYIYAGYYELWISDCELTSPLTYMGWCRTLENAIERCRRIDDDACVCYSKALREEVADYFNWCDDDDIEEYLAFFDSDDYAVNRDRLIMLCAECGKYVLRTLVQNNVVSYLRTLRIPKVKWPDIATCSGNDMAQFIITL